MLYKIIALNFKTNEEFVLDMSTKEDVDTMMRFYRRKNQDSNLIIVYDTFSL